jgi:hypothetical protein
MKKVSKLLNKTTIDYACVVLGLAMVGLSFYKNDMTLVMIGILYVGLCLSSITSDKSNERIKALEDQIKELKGDSNERN